MRDLLTMQERLESLFGRAAPGWVPPVDLSELGDRYVLTVELPGLQPRGRPDRLRPTARSPSAASGRARAAVPERYQQLERGQGQFSRSFRFALPSSADAITADLADGVLTVTVPKAAAPTATRIDVAMNARCPS